MKTIGTFEKKTNEEITGQLQLATLKADLVFRPCNYATTNSPDYDIYAGSYQLGSAWRRKAKDSARQYLSVKLDDPTFPSPVYAMLFEREANTYALMWDRPQGRTSHGNYQP